MLGPLSVRHLGTQSYKTHQALGIYFINLLHFQPSQGFLSPSLRGCFTLYVQNLLLKPPSLTCQSSCHIHRLSTTCSRVRVLVPCFLCITALYLELANGGGADSEQLKGTEMWEEWKRVEWKRMSYLAGKRIHSQKDVFSQVCSLERL